MNILFISQDLVGGNLAYKLKLDGHNVRLFIRDKNRRRNFENLVKKTLDWKKQLSFVGKDGLIIFDCNDFGSIQENLRARGYSVFGGCKIGDKLETDRKFGSEVFTKNKIKTVPILNFDSIEKAMEFINIHKEKWVIKQNEQGTGLKSFNYVGLLPNSEDVIDVLKNYTEKNEYKIGTVSLQKKIDGVEIAIGRFFNGTNWAGPICINLEHKKLFPGDLGPTTSEMGTVVWYENNEQNKLYTETLAKLEPFLKNINYKGYIDINCIANKNGIFPLEATARIGSPIIHAQIELHKSKWADFLKAIADGKSYNLKWKKGFGIVIVITVPTSNPFPFTKAERYVSPEGINIYFDKSMSKEDFKHVHFEDVSVKKVNGKDQYYISDDRGYVLYVTAVGKTVAEARSKADKIIKKIHIPKMFYRNDIGLKFINQDQELLKKWGYL